MWRALHTSEDFGYIQGNGRKGGLFRQKDWGGLKESQELTLTAVGGWETNPETVAEGSRGEMMRL